MPTVEEVRDLIRAGACVRLGFADGGRVWWIEHPHIEIDDAVMREAATGHNGQPLLREAGDCLFGWPGNSQTWISEFAA